MMLFHGPVFHRYAGPRHEELELPAGQAWSAVANRELYITCERGALWITVEGDPEDHVVLAPGHFTAKVHGRVAALALEPAHVAVDQPA